LAERAAVCKLHVDLLELSRADLLNASDIDYSEIGSIKPESFDWAASPATVTIRAAYAKNGQTATLPLPDDLTADLAAYVAARPAGKPIFPLPHDKGAAMVQKDLDAAGIPYQDASGRFFDFHSLRCELATLADAAGVSPRVVQKMMRHSKLEMTGRYTRPRAVDIDAAASMLPSLKPEGDRPEALAATGTDPRPVPGPGATENATEAILDVCNLDASQGLASISTRKVNPLVEGSSPSPVIDARTRDAAQGSAQTPSLTVVSVPSPAGHSRHSSRKDTHRDAPNSTPTATQNATRELPEALPADPDLTAVIAAWDRLPAAVKAGIVAMVKAASQ
jgi:hypothetical protein